MITKTQITTERKIKYKTRYTEIEKQRRLKRGESRAKGI